MTSLLILSLNTYVHPQNSFVISAVCSFSALCQHVCPSSKQLCHPLYHCMPSLLFLCIMSTHLSILKTALSSTVCQVCSFSALQYVNTFVKSSRSQNIIAIYAKFAHSLHYCMSTRLSNVHPQNRVDIQDV